MGIKKSKLLRVSIAMFMITIILLSIGCGSDEAKQLDPTKIAEYNKPGTVLVETVWSADVTIPSISIDYDALDTYLINALVNGTIPVDATDAEIGGALVAELVTNPDAYLLAGPVSEDRVTPMETSVYGSGFIVRQDGYIVTNAHLVKKSADEIAASMAESNAGELLVEDLANFEDTIGVDLPEDYENLFLDAAANIYATYYLVSDPTSETKMYTVSAGDKSISDGTVCEIVEVGDPMDINAETGKDVAVLKVNQDNLPTVPLGDDSGLMDGEQVEALGYPGLATFDYALDLTKEISPTLTQGVISAQKTMTGGWEIIQTDATISNGSSGSPLFNSKGEAIAVNTFGEGDISETTGEYVSEPGYNFAIPASVIKEFLDKANISPETGSLTKTYHEAVDLYTDEHYSAARDKFKEIQDVDSQFPYVNSYIEDSSAKINQGLDKSTFPIPVWLLIVIIALVIIVVGVVLVLLLVVMPRGKKQGPGMPGPQAAATPPPAPAPPSAETEETPKPEPAPTEVEQPSSEAAGEPEGGGETEPSGAVEEHNFCSKCGQQLDPDSEFCAKCGTPVI